MNGAIRSTLGLVAFDATIGAGNDSERVDFAKAERALGRTLSAAEKRHFEQEWRSNLQQMAQP